jgi:cold shock CspA family protein/ribosome-associated translation inhibitor RaiA
MEPQIEVNGLVLPSHARDLITAQLSKIEQRFGRLTSFRIAVWAPGLHHQKGENFSVRIRAALPGRPEIDVGRICGRDPRQSDLAFAVNDAFRRMKRQLQRQSTLRAPSVREHHGSSEGRILSLDPERGCGFIGAKDGSEIYFHAHSVLGHRIEDLIVGDRVAYHEEKGEKGPQASTVKLLKRRSGA